MSESKYKIGQFFWSDLTVPNANNLKDFYKEVTGWQVQEIAMDDQGDSYVDYAMMIDNETPAGGICHQRGVNKKIPPQWVMYINVENVEESLKKALSLGGKLIQESKKKDGTYNYVIVEDPEGAVFGLGNAQ